MGERVTFIHAGDIHLGAPFRGLRALSPAWADRLVSAIPDAYDRVIQACIDNEADFLLLCGDVFDTDKPSYAHYRRFVRGLKRLEDAGVEAYIIAGNHDPYPNWRNIVPDLPKNAHLFPSDGPDFVCHEKEGVPLALIAARGFCNMAPGQDIAEGMTRDAAIQSCEVNAPFCVGMLHTGLWMDPYKAPTSEQKLMASGMDYWALGHIHKRYVNSEANPRVAFCGCVQGRDIKETGDRGCLKVTLERGLANKVEFIACESVEWERLRVDVSDCAGADDVISACIRRVFDVNAVSSCDEMVVRITLEGKTPLHEMLSNEAALESLRRELNEGYPSFYCDALICATASPRDKAALVRSASFFSTLLKSFEKEERLEKESLRYLQEEFSKRGLMLPGSIEESMSCLYEAGEDVVLSLLGEADERGSSHVYDEAAVDKGQLSHDGLGRREPAFLRGEGGEVR